jgi:predicted dienelactone hydrolase
VLLAPGPVFLFAREGLAKVAAPIRLYYAERDTMVREPWNAQHLAAALPRRPETVTIPEAGHFAFLWPCPFGLREWICADRPGLDRAALHARMKREILDFLDRTLGRDAP